MYCFGIDVGGTSIKCGLFQTDGQLVEKWEVKTRTEENGRDILPDIATSIRDKKIERNLIDQDVVGVGVGVPGPVDQEGKISCAVNLNWGEKDIRKELEELLECPVRVANDANVAALGEMWKGGGIGKKNLILVTLGTGVGGGIIVNEKIVVGAHGAGGEIGHAHVEDQETQACNCGNYGCLEQVASATGIARLAKRLLQNTTTDSMLREQEISAKAVFDAYKENDSLAKQVAEEFAGYLGKALANFACVVDPGVIVIGGGVSKAGDILITCIEKEYRHYAFSACKNIPITLAKLGNDAGIYGAAKFVLDETKEK